MDRWSVSQWKPNKWVNEDAPAHAPALRALSRISHTSYHTPLYLQHPGQLPAPRALDAGLMALNEGNSRTHAAPLPNNLFTTLLSFNSDNNPG